MEKLILKKIDLILKQINDISSAKKIVPMFSISNTANVTESSISFSANRETADVICGNILVSRPKDAIEIANYVDGKVKVLLLDIEKKKFKDKHYEEKIRKIVKKSEVITFKPNDMTVDALDSFVSLIVNDITNKRIAIIGAGNIGSKIALRLLERDANVIITRKEKDREILKKIADGIECIKCKGTTSKLMYTTDNFYAAKNADVLLGLSAGTICIDEKMVNLMKNNGIIIDVGNKTISREGIKLANEKGIKIYTLFMKPGFDGQIKCLLETKKLIEKIGRKKVGRYNLVSFGTLGKKGDLLVDDIFNPTKIIGITDGQGGLIKKFKNLPSIEQIVGVKK